MATIYENRSWTPERDALEHVACNLCGADDAAPLAVENGLHVVRCRACGLVYVSPRPNARALARYYEQYYPQDSAEAWRLGTERLYRVDLARLERLELPARGRRRRALDAGCGYAFFPRLLRDHGWDARGCDLSQHAVEWSKRELDIEIDAGDFRTFPYAPGDFDVITAWCLLEHVPDPRRMVERAYELLVPGGVLAVRLPNHDFLRVFPWLGRYAHWPGVARLVRRLRRDEAEEHSAFYAVGPPAHLYGPTPRTFGRLLESCGFPDVRVHTDPMVARGTPLNRVVDSAFVGAARLLRAATGGRIDRSILFSLYARKPG